MCFPLTQRFNPPKQFRWSLETILRIWGMIIFARKLVKFVLLIFCYYVKEKLSRKAINKFSNTIMIRWYFVLFGEAGRRKCTMYGIVVLYFIACIRTKMSIIRLKKLQWSFVHYLSSVYDCWYSYMKCQTMSVCLMHAYKRQTRMYTK